MGGRRLNEPLCAAAVPAITFHYLAVGGRIRVVGVFLGTQVGQTICRIWTRVRVASLSNCRAAFARLPPARCERIAAHRAGIPEVRNNDPSLGAEEAAVDGMDHSRHIEEPIGLNAL